MRAKILMLGLVIFAKASFAQYFNLWSENTAAAVAGCSSITAYVAAFGGSAGMSITPAGSSLVNFSDAKTVTVSLWMSFSGGNATQQAIYKMCVSSGSSRFLITKETDNKLQFFARDTSGATCLTVKSSTTLTASSGWNHVYFCADLSDATTNKCKIYINGVADTPAITAFINTNIQFACGSSGVYSFAETDQQLLRMSGTNAEFWVSNTYLDSPSSFICNGHPADLGATGSTPGVTPCMYLSKTGSGSSWKTDASGNGNSFVNIHGTINTGTSP